MPTCSICSNSTDNTVFTAREMMFGMRDEFEYMECASCGCLQIVDIPDNLPDYYPDDYYSLNPKVESGLKLFLKRQRGRYALGKGNIGGAFLARKYGTPQPASWIKPLDLNFDSKILDVGSGTGTHLKELNNFGFKHLTGADPYIAQDIVYSDSFKILKKDISEVTGGFDFIMMNHALEHVAEQDETLTHIHRLLHQQGSVMIRIPVAGTYAWKAYGTNWVQLDAPRHLFLHTVKSFKILAEKTGFEIIDIVFDSTEFQFEGSERYLKDIPLKRTDIKVQTSAEKLSEYRIKAQELNEKHDGDQACFYLRKK